MGARPCRLKAISYQLVEGLQRKGLSPEEWLCQVVEQRINAIFSDGPTGWFPRLIPHKIHNQTPYFNDIRKTFLSAIRVDCQTDLHLFRSASHSISD